MGKNLKTILGVIFLVLLLFGLYKLGSSATTSRQNSSSVPGVNTVSSSDWTRGNKEAKTVLIEYSDFQCPACGTYYPVLKKLQQKFGESVVFAYRHFPLRQIHANAELAARSVEAAGKQSKFWELHDILFENQKTWSNQPNAKETIIQYAQSLNLDMDRFKTDLDSKEVKEKINNDYKSGIAARVNATPTFFLNGNKPDNPRSYEEFKDLIQKAISQNK